MDGWMDGWMENQGKFVWIFRVIGFDRRNGRMGDCDRWVDRIIMLG